MFKNTQPILYCNRKIVIKKYNCYNKIHFIIYHTTTKYITNIPCNIYFKNKYEVKTVCTY